MRSHWSNFRSIGLSRALAPLLIIVLLVVTGGDRTLGAGPSGPSPVLRTRAPGQPAETNRAPEAAFSWQKPGNPREVEFDGSRSRDPDGSVVEYAWDFGDGEAGDGAQVFHRYQDEGTYEVVLTVTDDAGARATHSKQVSPGQMARIVDAGMIAASIFRVTIGMDYQEGRQREIDLAVSLTSDVESSPLAHMKRVLRNLPRGVDEVKVDFDLASEGVPRFVEHVEAVITIDARELLADRRLTPTESHRRTTAIPLPVVITHGIMGDLAPLEYDSFGPGLPALAALLEENGYSEAIQYPTLKQLIYPSLHPDGVEHLAQNHMKPAVEALLERTYADRVDIVAHSMGGIVARAYVELQGGGVNVRRLVTLGTPHEGAAKAHSALAGYGSHEPSDTPGGTLLGLFSLQFPEFDSLAEDSLAAEALGDIGLAATVQLLPDYPYFTEIGVDGTPANGPGWPTDDGMDLQGGPDGLLGPNSLLLALNIDGLAQGVEYYQVYRDNHDTRTGVVRTDLGESGWGQYTVMGPGDGTVPLRSLILADYPELSAQLWKCSIPGTKHKEMILDPLVRDRVLAILRLPAGAEPDGCVR